METRRKSQRGCVMENLPVWAYIVGAFLTAAGGIFGYILPKAKSKAEKRNLDAETEHTEAETDSQKIDNLSKIIDKLSEQIEKSEKRYVKRMQEMQIEIDGLKLEIQRFAKVLREKDEYLKRTRKVIQEFIDRFHELRNEFYEEVGRWPVVGMPEGYEEYEEWAID